MERIPIFDLHCDTLDRLVLHDVIPEAGYVEKDAAIPAARLASLADNDAHIALGRMTHLAWCQCFAAFIPDVIAPEAAWWTFQRVRDFFAAQMEEHAALATRIRDARSVRTVIDQGKCAAIFTVEGGSFIVDTLERVDACAEAGVKMLTLTWNNKNAIASGNNTGDGLTPFGAQVVRALEERKIAVDVSHLNERSFWDVERVAARPFAASHSNAKVICGHPRNLSDDQFRAIAERGGVVGLNFYEAFLRDAGHATPDDLLRHADHFLNLGGERALALGSDYDGSDVPAWLEPAEKIATVYDLFAREFGEDIARAICFENAAAFFERNE